MKPPIKAEIFLVPTEDVATHMAQLTEDGTAAVTFTHVSGMYSAIAVDAAIVSRPQPKPVKGNPAPPPVPSFLGGSQ
jgi:hypothetical protein